MRAYSLIRRQIYARKIGPNAFKRGFATKRNRYLPKLETLNDVGELLHEMRRRRYNMTRIKIAACAVVGGIGYLFYDKVTDHASRELSSITTKSLEDPELNRELVEMGTKLGKQILKELSEDDEIKVILSDLFKDVFMSDKIKRTGADLGSYIVTELLTNDSYSEVREKVVDFAYYNSKEQAIRLANDSELQEETGKMMWKSFKAGFFGMSSEEKELIIAKSDEIAQVEDDSSQKSEEIITSKESAVIPE